MYTVDPACGTRPPFDRQELLRPSDLGYPSPTNEDLTIAGADDARSADLPALPRAYEPDVGILTSKPLPSPLLQQDLIPQTPTPSPGSLFSRLDIAGIADPLSSAALPTPPIAKAVRTALRLPSFDILGIAAAHPDRIAYSNFDSSFPTIGAGPLSKPEDPLHALSPALARPHPPGYIDGAISPSPTLPQQNLRPVLPGYNPQPTPHHIYTFTPPEESGAPNWKAIPNVHTTAMESPAKSDKPGQSPAAEVGSSSARMDATASPSSVKIVTSRRSEPWLEGALKATMAYLHAEPMLNGSVKVLSHALPSPETHGHVFPLVIDSIHECISPKPTVWINVFHALPGRFNVSDMPKSPPSTPGQVFGGEDYFTTKVFDSAVAVIDYQDLEAVKSVPHSPRPIVPPSTVDVSVVERYIPPTNSNEFNDLYAPASGRSILTDRLVELSGNDGTLMFIYPTRTGGRTFQNEYLGPIIDPLLRAMVVINNFSADLSAALGKMLAVDSLLEFRDMKSRVETLCEQLTKGTVPVATFHAHEDIKYTVIHASKQRVRLDRHTWSEWWIKQEKPKVRSVLTRYFKLAHKMLQGDEVIPTHLIQQILDGVSQRPYSSGFGPSKGVEVAVFVVRKSRSSCP